MTARPMIAVLEREALKLLRQRGRLALTGPVFDGPVFGSRHRRSRLCVVPGGDGKGPKVATPNFCNPELKQATAINYSP